MKKVFYVAICLFMASCSSAPKEKDVKASNVEITGFIKDYLKVVDGDYKFVVNGDEASITVKFELKEKPTTDSHITGWNNFKLNAIGQNGNVLEIGSSGFSASNEELSKIEDLLKGKVGDTKLLSFKWKSYGNSSNGEIAKTIFTTSTTFEIIDMSFKQGLSASITTSTTNDTNDDEQTVSTTNSNDWDTALTEYDEYIDKYIEFMKKGKAGDQTAMLEAVDLMSKAQSAGEKLQKANGELTTTQLNKFTKIQKKIINAM